MVRSPLLDARYEASADGTELLMTVETTQDPCTDQLLMGSRAHLIPIPGPQLEDWTTAGRLLEDCWKIGGMSKS